MQNQNSIDPDKKYIDLDLKHQYFAYDRYDNKLGDKILKKSFHLPINILYLYIDKWFNFAFGTKNNPLYHLGSLAFFLLWIITVSGLYIFIFFDMSILGAYSSLQTMAAEHWYHAGIMRSLHRYASDALLVVILLHIIREFSLDRYRGFRWFSWFTGVPSLWMIVLLGITGYWLVWDNLAQYVAIGSSKLLDSLPIFSSSMARNFMGDNLSDRFFILMAFIHLLGLPMMLVAGLWIHVKRLSKVEVFVPVYLSIGTFLALLILSLIKPALSQGIADPYMVAGDLQIDWFYLNVFPLMDYFTPGQILLGSSTLTVLIMLLPWVPKKQVPPPAVVDLDHCNGCGQCFDDCPFDAITMQKRTDGKRWEMEPVVIDDLCAACGICVGSCPYSNPFRKSEMKLATGIDMPEFPIHDIRHATNDALNEADGEDKDDVKLLVFACNHCVDVEELKKETGIATITMACTGMMPPSFVDYAFKQKADGVYISGCRSGDCYYRLGNHWMEDRIKGDRLPVLHKKVDKDRIKISGAAITDKKLFLSEIADFKEHCKTIKQNNSAKTETEEQEISEIDSVKEGE